MKYYVYFWNKYCQKSMFALETSISKKVEPRSPKVLFISK